MPASLPLLLLFLQADDPHRGVFREALGVECAHCHDVFATQARARRMVRMRDALSGQWLSGRGGLTCWTCHRGKAKPDRLPRAAWTRVFDAWPGPPLDEATLARPAREVFRNLQVLDPEAPASSVKMSMSVYSASLGVSCGHCHVAGRWESDERPAKAAARDMLRMFDEIPAFFDPKARPVFQCFTCHYGTTKPERRPPAPTPVR